MEQLILRQAAIDALRKMQTYKLFSGDDMLLIDQAGAMTELMLLSTAEPQERKGKWIPVYHDVGALTLVSWKCSKCGYIRKQGWEESPDGEMPEAKLCENCGCKMEVEHEV